MFQLSKGHQQGVRSIRFKTCFSSQRAICREYDRYVSRHVSALKGPSAGSTIDTFQDMFQLSKGHLQGVRSIRCKTCFSPQRAIFREYDRCVSRHVSALKGPSAGSTVDAFQDMFQLTKAIFRDYDRCVSRHVSALKGPSAGSNIDAFQDMFQSSKGHIQGV